MLKQRIVTALLMLGVTLPALFASSHEPFCFLALVLVAAAGWEWAKLSGCGPSASLLFGASLGLALGVLWWQVGLDRFMPELWQLAGTVWVLMSAALLRGGVALWDRVARAWRLPIGFVMLGWAWWAMAQARYLGAEMLLSILLLVWVADVAAYFGGKALGRHKLAPAISPGKSWEGVFSGMLAVLLVAGIWLWWAAGRAHAGSSLYERLWAQGPVVAVVGLLFLTLMSVVGDLIESLVKRSAGVKDSSGLLPGHGGVLDRIDALLPVLPLAMMLVTLP